MLNCIKFFKIIYTHTFVLSCHLKFCLIYSGFTLIQKLAEFSIENGADVESLRSLDPHTGAARISPGLQAEQTANPTMAEESHISDASCQASGID